MPYAVRPTPPFAAAVCTTSALMAAFKLVEMWTDPRPWPLRLRLWHATSVFDVRLVAVRSRGVSDPRTPVARIAGFALVMAAGLAAVALARSPGPGVVRTLGGAGFVYGLTEVIAGSAA